MLYRKIYPTGIPVGKNPIFGRSTGIPVDFPVSIIKRAATSQILSEENTKSIDKLLR